MDMPSPARESSAGVETRRKGVLRYIELAALFRRRIETGEWARDGQIPTVKELAQTCGVARETIRQALGVLEDERLIERHRARGTFVTGGEKKDLWCEIHADYFGILQTREGADIELLSEARNASAPHEIDFGRSAGAYRHLRRRHRRLGEPYLVTSVFIAEPLVERIPRSAFTRKTALKILADIPSIDIARIEQTMTIGSADMEIAELLDMTLNAPVALVDRYALGADGELLLLSNGTYRGDIVRLNIKLKGG